MFDYSILDRPILLFAYDIEDYVKDIRGTYFDIREERYGKDRSRFREKFNQYENENSSERIFNQVIKNEKSNPVSNLIKKAYSKLAYWFIKTF